MSTNVNDINKIYCNEPITVRHINMTSLLFIDGKVIPKSDYSIVDGYLNILEQAENKVALYQHKGSSYYYEYHISLAKAGTVISGTDIYDNILTGLTDTNHMIFVNGYKLLPSEYIKDEDGKSIEILTPFPNNNQLSTVIIYTSSSINYLGKINDLETWDAEKQSFTLNDYTYLRYMFFKNGEIITRDCINKVNNTVTINIKQNNDIFEFYRLPIDTENVVFDGYPGYLSYGPTDNFGLPIPELYDAEVSFQSIVRLAIDDVRKGFFIREADGEGCLMITCDNFETRTAYCTTIVKFSKDSYNKNEYFVQVPNARSILKYVSEYDLSKMLMPEILGSFQKLLLNETYDSIQRLKNIRSINKVGSSQITNLIKFMGLDIDTSDLTLAKKHALIEELTNFYNIVGTKESYNFYNTMTTNSKIVEIEQLFTPIRDYYDIETGDEAKRYVDFRTAKELGAITHTAYEFDITDFGEVDQLASPTDSFTNQPRDIGLLENPDSMPVLASPRKVYYTTEVSEITPEYEKLPHYVNKDTNEKCIVIPNDTSIPLNKYIIQPTAGPNKPSDDYDFGVLPPVGSEEDNAENFYDLGFVAETIKGQWIEWTEWNRQTNWYPTNHVQVAVKIPTDIDYSTFMTEFKNTFYDIASAVLYIHNIIEVYVFGKENPGNADEGSDGGANFGIVTSPTYYSIEWSFTNDPARQDYSY